MAPAFLQYPKLHQVEAGDSPYADARNHCQRYDYYSVRGERVTSVHECTHGINSQLRNHPLKEPRVIKNQIVFGDPYEEDEVHIACHAPLPAGDRAAGAVAGFYLLQDRAVMLTNPPGTISEAARLVPASARYGRFNLYMVKQAVSWNNEPLYVYDEWVAYRNGAHCLVWDATHGGTKDGNTDYIFGPLEFCTYGLAVAMMAHKRGALSEDLRVFTGWLLVDCFNLYFVGKQYAPWATANKLYEQFRSGADLAPYRQFCSDVLGTPVPSGVVDPSLPDNLLL